MERRKVRIGIDVGGTFTDAVVLDNETYEIIAKEKVPTTHSAEEGVAKGIVNIIKRVIEKAQIDPEDVVFIAHGTTQATNALLEGDVSRVGIIGIGSGIDIKTKTDTNVPDIELGPGKMLKTIHAFLDSKSLVPNSPELTGVLENFKREGIEVIVSAEAYSVDNPENELRLLELADEKGFCGTCSHEITKLYGLKTRTRTAVINASIVPKMMETANMTEGSVKKAGIKTPLMIMRCDGGVMTIDEVRKRPILTMLSGPAAGVAGALMYEKISDGIFFEVGGTSTDISVIKNGKVMIKYAEIGGHKTYLNSLDVRTLGIAGGSMIRVENRRIVDVGPRSAHIAGLGYEVFAEQVSINNAKLKYISPRKEDDKTYVIVESSDGREYALTLAGAANIAGMVPEGDYAYGNHEEARKAWEALAEKVGCTVEEAAYQVLKIGIGKVRKVVEGLIKEYELSLSMINFVGGGGSASVVVPFLAREMGFKHSIAKNAPYISTIGVALAMVREVVERTVSNPSAEDIKSLRSEALEIAVKSGAQEDTVEVVIEIDKQKNIIRAIATGATELRTRDLLQKNLDLNSLKKVATESANSKEGRVELLCNIGKWFIFKGETLETKVFGLFKKRQEHIRVLDNEGVVRLQKGAGKTYLMNKGELLKNLQFIIDENTKYGDAGEQLPETYLFTEQRLIDLSGLANREQILSLSEMELEHLEESKRTAVLVTY